MCVLRYLSLSQFYGTWPRRARDNAHVFDESIPHFALTHNGEGSLWTHLALRSRNVEGERDLDESREQIHLNKRAARARCRTPRSGKGLLLSESPALTRAFSRRAVSKYECPCEKRAEKERLLRGSRERASSRKREPERESRWRTKPQDSSCGERAQSIASKWRHRIARSRGNESQREREVYGEPSWPAVCFQGRHMHLPRVPVNKNMTPGESRDATCMRSANKEINLVRDAARTG